MSEEQLKYFEFWLIYLQVQLLKLVVGLITGWMSGQSQRPRLQLKGYSHRSDMHWFGK